MPLVTGQTCDYVDLDYAATTPPLAHVRATVEAFLPWYSSIHRGTGFKSSVATDAFERAREVVGDFVHAPAQASVVFVRNTTEAINLLAHALPREARVVHFASEHHANLLPWRRPQDVRLPVPHSPDDMLERLEQTLRSNPARPTLVSVTGASNVTGEIWPVDRVAAVAHRYGARLLVDGAQLVPHRTVDMQALGIDFLAFSGHKMYAPYGAGALVGPRDWLEERPPMLAGGGAIRQVREDEVLWADAPDRQEAGSPNVVGVVALAAACRALEGLDRRRAVAEEASLHAYARERLGCLPGVRFLHLWGPEWPHVGVLSFVVDGRNPALLAAALGAEHGVGVRYGSFCAHLLLAHLLGPASSAERAPGCSPDLPGAIRLSFGLGSTRDDVDRLAEGLRQLVQHGPAWTYEPDAESGELRPTPDPRPRPRFV